MLCFLWILLSALTIAIANPIPFGSDDSIDSSTIPDGPNNSNLPILNKTPFNLGLDVDDEDNPVISALPPNAPAISNSKIVTDPLTSHNVGCTVGASPDSYIDNDIQKRGRVCPAGSNDPVSHPSTLMPAGQSRKSTSSSTNPCRFYTPNYVTCGGTEYMASQSSIIIAGIPNCVPASVEYIEERSVFLQADQVADYCCQKFANYGLLFAAYGCTQFTNILRPRKPDTEFQTDMERLLRQHNQRQNN